MSDDDTGFFPSKIPPWAGALAVFILFSVCGFIGTCAFSRATAASEELITLRIKVGVLEAQCERDKADSDRRFADFGQQLRDANVKLDRVLDDLKRRP